MSDFDWLKSDSAPLETTLQLEESHIHKRRAEKRQMIRITKRTIAEKFLTELVGIGETWHIISNAKFDFWTWIPVMIGLMGGHIETLYGSTWTMARTNVEELFEHFDAGKIGEVAILTGTYFKRRETAVFATLLEGLQARHQRYIAFENHAKVMLLSRDPNYITIEGSANFTSNPRLEQYTMTNDRDLYEFHRHWMEEMLNAKRK